jgi:hypothetical protein
MKILTFSLAIVVWAVPVIADAQSIDYLTNETPYRGQARPPLVDGSLWLVVSARLNCRQGAGMHYSIVRQFRSPEVLQAEVGRGGSDEVLWNVKDRQGQPWMPARSAQGENYHCFVRANSRYIQPYLGRI